MFKHFQDIEHSRIDALSDGIFAIALTLLGFDLIGSVKKASEAESLSIGLAEQWPVYFSFLMGFFVLYAIWYQYHVVAQFAGRPNALMVWQHGFGLLFASLVPFGAALLGENLNTTNAADAVFWFGVIIFADAPIQLLFFIALRINGHLPMSEDAPFSGKTYARMGTYLSSGTTVYGLISVIIALEYPWHALALYAVHLLTKVTPVTSINRLIARFGGWLKIETSA
ncbi:MAG: TMEM175 family protein [Rhodoluna sp.]